MQVQLKKRSASGCVNRNCEYRRLLCSRFCVRFCLPKLLQGNLHFDKLFKRFSGWNK